MLCRYLLQNILEGPPSLLATKYLEEARFYTQLESWKRGKSVPALKLETFPLLYCCCSHELLDILLALFAFPASTDSTASRLVLTFITHMLFFLTSQHLAPPTASLYWTHPILSRFFATPRPSHQIVPLHMHQLVTLIKWIWNIKTKFWRVIKQILKIYGILRPTVRNKI